MTKYILAFTILWIFGGLVIDAAFDKNAAMDDFMAKLEECKTDAGATDADVKDILGKVPASTAEGKCLRSCIMKKYEMMTVNGTFVPAIAIKHAETFSAGDAEKIKKAKEVVNTCARIKVSTDHCQAAEQYGKCFMKHAMDRDLTQFKV
ncbi:general odorant-binding protein 28a-like [Musca vetustissima]|uniref:general odorant-binding protein 28a-like n=1 Tax=Musca vetustissima TaxID=27455 RepID=UPI002AB6062C|nr:general odorant-binding protein 28a-like [Musca vetustissima]